MKELFFELLEISLGCRDNFSTQPSGAEWRRLYDMANQQSLVGICCAGIQRVCDYSIGNLCGMDEIMYLTWMGITAKIQERNRVMNDYTGKILSYFREKGFPCQVLKGQGIASLYGDLILLRQSGDIDVWLKGGRWKIYDLSRKELGLITGANYHHIHYPIYDDIEIEAHIYPSFLSSPFCNKSLHRFCEKYIPIEGCDDYPSLAFNRVFILLHCYRHLCGHGVGLRQLMDYYFVLKKGFTDMEREDTLYWCRKLGMKRFLAATMWVMQHVFHLEDEYLLCEPDEKEGRFLLSEVMNTGNMGHADTRYKWGQNTPLKRFIASQKRNIHLMTHYPHEVCWSPFFNMVRFFWLRSLHLS